MTKIIKTGIKLGLMSYTALALGVTSFVASKIFEGESVD